MKFIAPMMPKLVDAAPTGEGWIHEVKFDGYRTQVHVDAGAAAVFTRNGTDWTEKYAPIAHLAAKHASPPSSTARCQMIEAPLTFTGSVRQSPVSRTRRCLWHSTCCTWMAPICAVGR